MPAIFVHVSDIHFGQEIDDRLHIHNDVKEQLITDAADIVRELSGGIAHGILVTGDIAQAGRHEQYVQAGQWLDQLAQAIGCKTFNIQMVPGNHDLDRAKLSRGGECLLNVIRSGDHADYEAILANDSDRAVLFSRFEDYGRFSEGYDCPLDTAGKYSTNLRIELAQGRAIRFVRLNSALLCTGKEGANEPELMVGARQFTIPRVTGEENVILIHHPLHWFKDSAAACQYLRSRSRVIISGHEHNPRVNVEEVEVGSDLMMLAAGATVPYQSNQTYTFTYNIMVFDWDLEKDALAVAIHPRVWNPHRTCFESDSVRLGGANPRFVLGSPNFRKSQFVKSEAMESISEISSLEGGEPVVIEPLLERVAAIGNEGELAMPHEVDGYRLLLLQFFRDLTEGERLRILVELEALPSDSDEPMTHAIQRYFLGELVRSGNISKIFQLIEKIISNRNKGVSNE